MADALAAAVERLRARAEAAALAPGEAVSAPDQIMPAPGEAAARAPEAPAPQARDELAGGTRVVHPAPAAERPPHKHSLSWFARQRIKRKQRRTP
jgi:hypothetical protein